MPLLEPTLTIDVSESTTVSTSVRIDRYAVVGIGFPASFDSATMTMQGSFDGSAWLTFPSATNFSASASHYEPLDWYLTEGISYFRLSSSVQQLADRTITLAMLLRG